MKSGFMPIYRVNFVDYDGKCTRSGLDTDAMTLTIPERAFAFKNLKVRGPGPGGFRPANHDRFMMDLAVATGVECVMHTSGRVIIQLDEGAPYYYMEPYLQAITRWSSTEVFFAE